MNLKVIYTLALLLFGALLFTNCASLTGFETGKTVGEGNGFFTASLNATRTPDFDLEIDDTTDIGSAFFFPNIELSGRYGILEKLDIGLKANTNFNVMLDAKYQLLGSADSKTAVSVGLGAGTFGLFSSLWNVQVPVYLSYHPSDKMAVYVTPRYVAQFSVGDLNVDGGLNYLGGNAGLMFGRDTKFGLDFGYYQINADGDEGDFDNLMTFGLGVQIPF